MDTRAMWFVDSLLAALLYSSLWLFARASKGMPSSVVTAFQFLPGPLMLLYYSAKINYPWDQPIWYVFLITTFVIVPPFSWALNFASQRIEVTLIKPLSALSGLSALIAGMLFANQTIKPIAIAGILVSTAGLMLLYHARWSVWKKPFPWIALASVLVFGFNAVIVGMTLRVFPYPLTITATSLTGGFILSALGSTRKHKHMKWNKRNVVLLLSYGVACLSQELFTSFALAAAPAALVISVKRSSIIIASLAGYFLFKEREIPMQKLLAASAIVLIGLIMMLQ